MINGIDISNWQASLSLITNRPGFAILKATEGSAFVDKSCDKFAQQCIKENIPFGFYHFARTGSATQQARFFRNNTKGYEGIAIPILDFEDARCDNSWMESFVKEYHAITGVFPWIYMNNDFINNRGYGTNYVKKNCGLWMAGYPSRATTYPANTVCPYKHTGWTLAAWQFTDRLRFGGLSVDGDVFYGSVDTWKRYATGGKPSTPTSTSASSKQETLENNHYKITIQSKE